MEQRRLRKSACLALYLLPDFVPLRRKSARGRLVKLSGERNLPFIGHRQNGSFSSDNPDGFKQSPVHLLLFTNG